MSKPSGFELVDNNLMNEVDEYIYNHKLVELFEDLASSVAYCKPKNLNEFLIERLELKKKQGLRSGLYTEDQVRNIFKLFDIKQENKITKERCIKAFQTMANSTFQFELPLVSKEIPLTVTENNFVELCKKFIGLANEEKKYNNYINMLENFFNPKSVAVIGVSEDPKKLGSLIFQNVINAKFNGNLYPINSRIGGKILYGYQSYKSIKEIEEPIDLAIIVVGAKFCSAIVDDCILNGTKNISIIAAGFSEIGNSNLEKDIVDKCSKNNINLLGPNCLGHISTFTNLNASFSD